MLGNEAAACEIVALANPNARTSSAAGGYVDVRGYEGDLLIMLAVGTVSGSTPTLNAKVRDATTSGGSGLADIPGAVFEEYTNSNHVAKIVIPAGQPRGWIHLDWTIAGSTPSFTFGAWVIARPKMV